MNNFGHGVRRKEEYQAETRRKRRGMEESNAQEWGKAKKRNDKSSARD